MDAATQSMGRSAFATKFSDSVQCGFFLVFHMTLSALGDVHVPILCQWMFRLETAPLILYTVSRRGAHCRGWFGVVVISRPPSSFHVEHQPSSPLVIVSGQLFPETIGHRISNRHRRGINISKIFSNRRHNWHGNGTSGANHDGPEERRSFAGCPATVLERGGPKDGG